jgi:replicative DNA helicase
MNEIHLRWNDEELDAILSEIANNKPVTSTGFEGLDTILGGGLYSGLHILAAEPSLGKTTLVLQIADYVARFGSDIKVLFFSQEMSRYSIVAKSLSRISYQKCPDGDKRAAITARGFSRLSSLGDNQQANAREVVETYREQVAPSIATISKHVTVNEIGRYMTACAEQGSRPLAVVDYLQVLQPDQSLNNAEERSQIINTVTGLCNFAADLKMPVLSICSFNRGYYSGKNNGMTPLSSLSGSASLEYGADVVMYLSLDCLQDECGETKKKPIRPVKLEVIKNRNGQLGETLLDFDARFGVFTEKP